MDGSCAVVVFRKKSFDEMILNGEYLSNGVSNSRGETERMADKRKKSMIIMRTNESFFRTTYILVLLCLIVRQSLAQRVIAKDGFGVSKDGAAPQFQRCANFQATYSGAYLVHRDLFMEGKGGGRKSDEWHDGIDGHDHDDDEGDAHQPIHDNNPPPPF